MKKTVRLLDLDCANCAAKMEAGIREIAGVEQVSVNFLSQKMVLEAPAEKLGDILVQAEKIIHRLEPDVTIKS
jgi:copper chaperone CopZ